MIYKWIVAVAVLVCALASARAHEPVRVDAQSPWQEASDWPDRIVVTFAADPARSIAVTWRTNATTTSAQAQIVRATPDARFDVGAASVPAVTELLDLTQVPDAAGMFSIAVNAGLPRVNYHSVVFTGLQPDTLYAYRVGSGDRWSEWFQIRTAPLSGPITFIYLGDAQNGILSHWSRTIRASFVAAPDARFIIHAGDLVNQGSHDLEWAQWFKAVGFIHGMIPAVPVAGNHEYARIGANPVAARRVLSMMWRPQFTLAVDEALPPDLKETVYTVHYSTDLDVFVLDTNASDMTIQGRWLDAQLSASTARWRVATFHHPIFSSGRDRDNPNQRGALLPILRKHNVDLVLQGHDHTYARGSMFQSPERFAVGADSRVQTMFVNSVSGPKQYEFSTGGWDQYVGEGVRLDRRAENTQFFQVIRIDGPQLTYEARTADGRIYDAFVLEKDGNGAKRLTQGKTSTMDPRAFSNTPPYPGTDALKD